MQMVEFNQINLCYRGENRGILKSVKLCVEAKKVVHILRSSIK